MEKFEHLDWIIANKDFLKNLGLFEYIASSIKKWLEDSKQLSKIADNEDSLEIADDIKSEIANNAIKLINKTSDLQFIENVNVQSFLSKEDKKNIFDKFKNIFADSDESLEKRKDVARLLLKSNAIWNEIEVNDIYRHHIPILD